MDHFARSSLNFFAALPVDRLSGRRLDALWIRERIRDSRSRIVPVWRSRNLLAGAEELRPVLLSPADLGDPSGLENHAVLLGSRGETVYFAVELVDPATDLAGRVGDNADFRELREAGPLLAAEDGALLAYARAITYWHRRHRYCGDCGSPTRSAEGGHIRVCINPDCGQKHFPRTDAAIIVLVTRRRGRDELCLLGRQPVWPVGMHSAIAGFVEPGETLEQAVVREVREETDIRVDRVDYQSSQPWPFPSSIMLGFTARATSGDIRLNDGELQHAAWFTRRDIAAGLAEGSLKVPRRISIAYRLLEDWFDDG
ncbi:MAG: NAD(+) diphosphatase, partial [Gammaproteobacteria bacterium]|nr:NAD(+) diphosphatase [Gammaproteobacteria bacterium]